MATAPRHFGKYEVLERLGAGGMAEVFKCRLEGIGGFDKLVVVKTIHAHWANDPAFVEMFLDEARIAANLTHPNVVQIFEVDRLHGVPWLAMEYVNGGTMASLLQAARAKRRLHFGYAAKIIAGMAAGLHYAHTAVSAKGEPLGIVHRDVSPQNVMVSTDGIAKLLDFGVAKARGRLAQTSTGTLKGKLRYMAPELLRAAPASARSDVYAAGVCLWEVVTGEQLHAGLDDADLLGAVGRGVIRPPTELFPGCPAELERIVLWALEADPAKRCPTALDLQEALEDFVAAGAYAASTGDLADWVADMLPPPGKAPHSSVMPAATPTPAPRRKDTGTRVSLPPPPVPAEPRAEAAAVPAPVSAAASAPRKALPFRPVHAAIAIACLAAGALIAGPSSSHPADVYLAAAERELAAGHPRQAERLLAALPAAELGAEQDVRRISLTAEAERAAAVGQVRGLVALGDLPAAEQQLRKNLALDLDPRTVLLPGREAVAQGEPR